MNKKSLVMTLFALPFIGCTGLVPTMQKSANLVVKPSLIPGGQQTQTVTPVYSSASIHHLNISLFIGASEIASRSLPQAQLNNSVVFSNLKANTSYQLKGYAYLSSDNSTKISDDASSSLDITMGNNDQPTIGALTVALINRPFNGQGTSSLSITPGGYLLGNEKVQFINQGRVSTLAGSSQGYLDGTGTNALFNMPLKLVTDKSGNVYIGEYGSHHIRKITPLGVVTTIAGNGTAGFVDGTGSAARFSSPNGIALDDAGNLYVADRANSCIRKVTSAGVVSTLAGNGSAGYLDGTGTAAMFKQPVGLTIDRNGILYVAEYNNRIRKVTLAGVVSTLAGSGTAGYLDGPGNVAQFNNPWGIAVDEAGYAYVVERSSNHVRKITPEGVVSTLAGSGAAGYLDGSGTAATFTSLGDVAVDISGNVYVSELIHIRKITPEGVVSTFAGAGSNGTADGTGTSAQFSNPEGMTIDSAGNIYVAETGNHRIRVIR